MTTITFAVKSLNRMSQVWDSSTVTAVQCWGLAQSVEHAAVNRSVVGSSPTGGVFGNMKSDIKFNFLPGSMVKRLRHRPFTAVTGVQIPLESLCKISYI